MRSLLLTVLLWVVSCGRLGFDAQPFVDSDGGEFRSPELTFSGVAPAFGLVGNLTDPDLSDDGLEIFMSRSAGVNEIIFATRDAPDAAWSELVQLPNLGWFSATDPQLSVDRLTLWVAAAITDTDDVDIVVSTRASLSSPWGAVVRESGLETDGDEFGLSVDATGLAGVYAFGAGGAADDTDLYMVSRPSLDADWVIDGAIDEVNSAVFDGNPELSADGLTLFFDSVRDGTERAIFVAARPTKSEPFAAPVKVGGLEPEARDPSVSADGGEIYFSSDRDGDLLIYRATLE